MEGYVVFRFLVEKEDDEFISHCEQLGIVSCGSTIDEALSNLKDAVEVYLNTIEELGERRRVFREKGIRIQRKTKPSEQVARVSVRPDTVFTPYIHYLKSSYAAT